MKTNEFIKKADELGFSAGKLLGGDMVIFAKDGIIVSINEDMPYGLIMDTKHLKYLTNELFDLCVEYARTSIKDRKDEKRFYLQKMKSFYDTHYNDVLAFLNFDESLNQYFLFNNGQYGDYKTQFTQKEIDKIKKKFNTDLEEFRQVEVEE